MSTTVTYKGSTLTTVDNDTVTLETAGKYCEDDFTLTDVSGGGVNNVVISWENMVGCISKMYYPNNATVATDPDQPWITTITLPENSLIAGYGPYMSGMPSVSGLTQQVFRNSNTGYYYFFVGTTNGSISG